MCLGIKLIRGRLWMVYLGCSIVTFQSLVGIVPCFVPIAVIKIMIKSNHGRKVFISPYILQSIIKGRWHIPLIPAVGRQKQAEL